MRADTLKFPKEKYFSDYSVQENFNLITSFMQDLADKHIPSKTSLLRIMLKLFVPYLVLLALGFSNIFVYSKL